MLWRFTTSSRKRSPSAAYSIRRVDEICRNSLVGRVMQLARRGECALQMIGRVTPVRAASCESESACRGLPATDAAAGGRLDDIPTTNPRLAGTILCGPDSSGCSWFSLRVRDDRAGGGRRNRVANPRHVFQRRTSSKFLTVVAIPGSRENAIIACT